MAAEVYKEILSVTPANGKIREEALQEYLDRAYGGKQIPKKVDAKDFVDYSLIN